MKSLSLQDESCKSPIKCPVCFRRVNGDPVPNTELRRYLEKRVDDTPNKEVGMCDECGEKPATKYCIECGSGYYKTFAGFCDECWDAQHKSAIKSRHTLSPNLPILEQIHPLCGLMGLWMYLIRVRDMAFPSVLNMGVR